MTRKTLSMCVVVAAMLAPSTLFLGGCDREVEHTSDTEVKSNGTVKQHETTVKQSPDGTVTKEETVKKNTPGAPPANP